MKNGVADCTPAPMACGLPSPLVSATPPAQGEGMLLPAMFPYIPFYIRIASVKFRATFEK